MGQILKKITSRLNLFSKKMDAYQEALTFAEAGHHEYTADAAKPVAEVKASRKLLVVGRESDFSENIIAYALDMAKKLSYDIVALNTVPLSNQAFSMFSEQSRRIGSRFKEAAEKNARKFQQAADAQGVNFEHVVKFKEPDDAIEEVRKEKDLVEFIITEPTEEQLDNKVQDTVRPRSEIFVYSMQ